MGTVCGDDVEQEGHQRGARELAHQTRCLLYTSVDETPLVDQHSGVEVAPLHGGGDLREEQGLSLIHI